MEFIVKRGSGFIYYISREGVTGMQKQVASNLAQQVAKIRAHTKLPIAVGFGISTPDQAKAVAAAADAVVVGSAIVETVERNRGREAAAVGEFVRGLSTVGSQVSVKTG